MNNQFKFVVSGGNPGVAKGLLIFLGLVLVTISTLVFLFPKFFAYLFAGLVLLAGLSLIGLGLRSKSAPTPFRSYPSGTEEGSYEELRDELPKR